jgi:hypothetical protein
MKPMQIVFRYVYGEKKKRKEKQAMRTAENEGKPPRAMTELLEIQVIPRKPLRSTKTPLV